VSVGSSGAEGDNDSFDAAISAEGRFVAFSSHAWTLVDGDEIDTQDVFVHDRQTGVTERVGVDGHDPAISADGRFVALRSSAPNLGAHVVRRDSRAQGDRRACSGARPVATTCWPE